MTAQGRPRALKAKGNLSATQLLAGAAELRSRAAHKLQLVLVDHQLEKHRLCVANLDDTQQDIDGVGWLEPSRLACTLRDRAHPNIAKQEGLEATLTCPDPQRASKRLKSSVGGAD